MNNLYTGKDIEVVYDKTQWFVGIDPGKSGGICFLSLDKSIALYHDFPQKEHEIPDFFDKILDMYTYEIPMTIIERVHAMPKQGSVSMFNFGVNYGMWKMLLHCMKQPYDIVTPQKWMKHYNIAKEDGKTTKDIAQTVIKRLFPTADVWGKKGAYKDGRGDALLMANYARFVYMGN